MKIRTFSICAAVAVIASPMYGLCQDAPEYTREQWKVKVEAARRAVMDMRKQGKSFAPVEPTFEELEAERSQRVLQDDSLQSGDIVSTGRGLFRYDGRSPGSASAEFTFVGPNGRPR